MRRIEIVLSEKLYRELEAAVAEVDGMGVSTWAAECVESVMASRRLPHVIPTRRGPRVVETMTDFQPQRSELRAMRAAEIPSNYDLDSLADIT